MNNTNTFRRVALSVIGVAALMACGCSQLNAIAGVPSVRPQVLRTEYRVNPLGIDSARPRLSWEINDSRRAAVQTAYQVLVAGSDETLSAGRGDVWDSGKVESDEQHLIEYAGRPLASGERCVWKVRVWDKYGQPSAWSQPAVWSMGLLQPADWKGKWIGLDEKPKKEAGPEAEVAKASWIWAEANAAKSAPAGTLYFRRNLTVPEGAKIRKATSSLAVDNSLTLFVNGTKIGAGYNFGVTTNADITDSLHAGANTVAIAANNAGDNANPAGLIGAIVVEFEKDAAGSPKPLVVLTTDAWRVSDKEAAGWEKPGFDDASWKKAAVLGKYGLAPWGQIKLAGADERRLPARYLRHDFKVEKPIKRATAYICGLGYYELYLNGRKVGDHVLDPGLTGYDKRAYYVTYDVTGRIREAANAVGVILGNGRFFAPRSSEPIGTTTYGYPKLMLQLAIEYGDGSVQTVVSDESWRLTTNGPIRANNDYDGEEYDSRLDFEGWSEPGFSDSKWEAARLVNAPAGKLAAQMVEPIRVTKTIKPLSVKELTPGVYIYDMGQNFVGWVRLQVKGPAGTKVKLRHAEVLHKDGSLSLENIRGAKVTDIYTLKGQGVEEYTPRFSYHGFRFVEMTGYPGKPTLETIEGQAVHSDLERMGSFECSNDVINRVYNNIMWGVRGNLRSIPTDCPQRDERQGWLGDPANESKQESFEFNAANFYAKWLQDIEDAQNKEGSVPDVAPTYWTLYNNGVTWPSAYLIIPDWFHEQYADTRLLADRYASMAKWIDFMTQYIKDDLMPRDTYGDWCVPPEKPELIHSQDPARRTDPVLLGTTYFYHDLMLMARYATILGKTSDAERFTKLADRLKVAFNKKFYNAEKGIYSNGTQTSSVLPLYFGMVPADQRARVFANLVDNIVTKCNGHLATGLIGGQWLMRVLSDNGRVDVAYRLATQTAYPSWGYMANHGATTIWELWNGDTADPGMNSHNHLMLVGDLGLWMYEYMAGIRSDVAQPAFKRIRIRPMPTGDLAWTRAAHHSVRGWVRSEWHRTDAGLSLKVTIPANASAEVSVPTLGKQGVTVTESGATVLAGGKGTQAAAGVKFVRMDEGAAVFEVGSGTYNFAMSGR
jgi:alpha-L-rhamnosidase